MAHSTDMAHALLGASSSHRWLHCTPSARLEEHVPNVSSEYADEGTLAHAMGAKMLKSSLGLPTDAEQAEIEQFKHHLKPEMAGFVCQYHQLVWKSYQNACAKWKNVPGAVQPRLYVEQHIDYSPWVPEGFGTGDACIVSPGRLSIIDLKYGKGVKVLAQDNPQLKLYALGALDLYDYAYDIQTVTVNIVQPRINHIDSWSLSRDALMEWADGELKRKAQLAWEGKGARVAGSWCKFCRVKKDCPEQTAGLFGDMDI